MPSKCEPRFNLRSLIIWLLVGAASADSNFNAATNETVPAAPIDPAFKAGLATLRRATGIIEETAASTSPQWSPNLQLLIGMKAAQGSNQTVRFVELTTLRPPPTNTVGQPWSAPLQTNRFGWSGTNSERRTIEFISGLYPVRIRVFDLAGKKIEEGSVTLPWELLTNSLAELCRTSLSGKVAGDSNSLPESDEALRSLWGGLISLITVFAEIQSAPALNEVCEKARCAVRLPSLWTMVKAAAGRSLVVNLEPRFNEIAVVEPEGRETIAPAYRLFVDMKSEKKVLTTIEIIASRAEGANVLLAGIQSIRAVHPTKTNQAFTAQVLAVGRNESREGRVTTSMDHR